MPYERTEERRGYANGFKPKTMTTRIGKVIFAVPQVRDGSFYPQALEKGLRSERALMLALTEMYAQGVSTRKVAAITGQLCGVELTSTQVRRAAAQRDTVLEPCRTRPLGVTPSFLLDARHEKMRIDGQVHNADVLIAWETHDPGHVGVCERAGSEVASVSPELACARSQGCNSSPAMPIPACKMY